LQDGGEAILIQDYEGMGIWKKKVWMEKSFIIHSIELSFLISWWL